MIISENICENHINITNDCMFEMKSMPKSGDCVDDNEGQESSE